MGKVIHKVDPEQLGPQMILPGTKAGYWFYDIGDEVTFGEGQQLAIHGSKPFGIVEPTGEFVAWHPAHCQAN